MAKAKSRLGEISIRSLGVIENSLLECGPGLNVLTGETGAGKTMVLTAIGLVLGGRADVQLVRHGAGRCIVSATFEDAPVGDEFLDEGSLILTRSITDEGKSKATAGGVTVAASVLSELGQALIEVHGQSASQTLSKATKQRELLDGFGGLAIKDLLTTYGDTYHLYRSTKERLAAMKSNAAGREAEISSLQEFLDAGNRLKPKVGELESLEAELSRLSSVEGLSTATLTALELLGSEEGGTHSTLSAARRSLDSIKGKDPALDEIASQFSDSYHLLTEALHDLRAYSEALQADPARLEALQLRKAELNSFIRKFGKGRDLDEIIEVLKGTRAAIADLQGGDERIAEVEHELARVKGSLLEAAQHLTTARNEAARDLSDAVSKEIHSLAMPHTNFRVSVVAPDYSGSLKESNFSPMGCDEVVMEIQGHLDAPFIPLSKGASGGELSRIMLALEVVIAKSQPVGTYIFDEVDAGVGGKAAIEVGKRLHLLSREAQVIVVTHLPQVAAWADTHFTVTKESDGSILSSGVRKLNPEERVEEIARMLAGLGESVSAREHATELLALPQLR